MLKMYQLIEKNKLLKICISLLLVLTIMFCTASQTALKASAVATEMAAVYFVVATVAASLGIAIATDSEGQQAVSDFFYSCGDAVKEKINEYARNVTFGTMLIVSYDVDGWKIISHAVYDYFVGSRGDSNNNYVAAELNNDNSLIGFTADSQFNFTIADGSPFVYTHISLGGASLTVGNYVKALELRQQYPEVFPYLGDLTNQASTGGTLVPTASLIKLSASDGFSWVEIDWTKTYVNADNDNLWWKYDCSGTYTSKNAVTNNPPYSFTCDNNRSILASLFVGRNPSINQFTNSSQSGVNYAFCDSYGSVYDIAQNDNGKYVFKNYTFDNIWYDGMEFDSVKDAINYFFNQCGLSLPNAEAGIYTPGDTRDDAAAIPGVTVGDPANAKQRLDDIDAINSDAVSVALPGTNEMLEELEANPDAVLVDDAAIEAYPQIFSGVYTGDIEHLPTVNGAVWKTKFPFCLPFDIMKLFTGFKATAEAPKIHLLVMPENSFGLQNDEFYIDIDFSDEKYNFMVQITRFFLALSFVLWLISISRKMIGSGGG